MPGMMFNVIKKTSELKPHPFNMLVYGNEIVDEKLLNSIKEKGLLEPIVIKDDNTIISGHRRVEALKVLGLNANCRTITFDNELDEKECLIEFNRQRIKTHTQNMVEGEELEFIVKERARLKQIEEGSKCAEFGKLGGRGNKTEDKPLPADLPEGVSEDAVKTLLVEIPKTKNTIKKKESNESRTIIAEKLGMKATTYRKEKEMWEKAKQGDEVAKDMFKKLDAGEITTNAAHSIVKLGEKANEGSKTAEKLLEDVNNGTITPNKAIKELKANKNRMAYVGSIPNGKRDSDAWYTPKIYIDAVREVLGEIDLDPYSDEIANNTVKAKTFYSINNPAEENEWDCKTVWMNPPYTAQIIKPAVCKFIEEYKKYNFEGIVITNNATETKWFKSLVTNSKYYCFTDHRISFETYDGKNESNNTRGQTFFYFGNNPMKFKSAFSKFGWCGSYGGK